MSNTVTLLILGNLILLVVAVVWLVWRDCLRQEHVAQIDKTLKGALESQAMIVGLLQKAAGRKKPAISKRSDK